MSGLGFPLGQICSRQREQCVQNPGGMEENNVHGEGGSGKGLHFWGQGKVTYGASEVEEAKGEKSEL